MPEFDCRRIERCFERARSELMARRNSRAFWEGHLSSSALATATAVMALEMVCRHKAARASDPEAGSARALESPPNLKKLVERGIAWIVAHQNSDGGWGDTPKSLSNISTAMLCHAALHAVGAEEERRSKAAAAASGYIERSGGIPALRARYGKDKTFSIPILTHCALAGVVDWREVSPLPFELACLPARFYKLARLPVVSYALPALIAIGQARHHFVKPRNPAIRWLRDRSIGRSLAVLERLQPVSGGFLEATPLTSFVTMSLAGIGLAGHPVARRGVEFLVRSAREDGSWSIDTNLSTWLTTLSVNALAAHLPADARAALRDWLLDQQYRDVHPYTNADPGGWAWTDLPGGVPDADDTPGAILALSNLAAASGSSDSARGASAPNVSEDALDRDFEALSRGLVWLLGLQNRDGGWPTFCRGWGTLPFDRSAPDLTAHALRAITCWIKRGLELTLQFGRPPNQPGGQRLARGASRAIERGFAYLEKTQRPDGSWLPLWFGNQHAANDENPTYGTSRVLAAYRDADRADDAACRRGVDWLIRAQNPEGGWGGASTISSSVEETALAVEVLVSLESRGASDASRRGLAWLLDRVDQGTWVEPSPIGFYFAKLWYFEDLYPLIFTVAALRRAVDALSQAHSRNPTPA